MVNEGNHSTLSFDVGVNTRVLMDSAMIVGSLQTEAGAEVVQKSGMLDLTVEGSMDMSSVSKISCAGQGRVAVMGAANVSKMSADGSWDIYVHDELAVNSGGRYLPAATPC